MNIIQKSIKIFLFIIGCMLVYVVLIYGLMFLFPQNESYIPPVEIVQIDTDNTYYREEPDAWYSVENKTLLEWNFSYVDKKAYFVSPLHSDVVTIAHENTDIIMVDSRKATYEQHLIAYEIGIVNIYTVFDNEIKKTHSINTSNIIILAKFIPSGIFVLSLDYDLMPEVFWFREHEGEMEEVGRLKMKEPFQHIGAAINIDGVGVFVHIDDDIILFDNETMQYTKRYEFASLENVLGNSEFYIIEYMRGNMQMMDGYINKEKIYTFNEDSNKNNQHSGLGVIDANAFDTSISEISLYRVSKEDKIYEFKKGDSVFSITLP